MGLGCPKIYHEVATRLHLEAKLIHEIQIFCRHRPCFQTETKDFCAEQDCEWRRDCRKLIAIWHR